MVSTIRNTKKYIKSLDENHPRAIEVKHMIELIEGEINAS